MIDVLADTRQYVDVQGNESEIVSPDSFIEIIGAVALQADNIQMRRPRTFIPWTVPPKPTSPQNYLYN